VVTAGEVEAGELVLRSAQTDRQALDLAEPSVRLGLADPFSEVRAISMSRCAGRRRLDMCG
jgi:hypothetical protein